MTTTTTSNQYFYQNQQDQYTFYRIPKALIKGVRYQHVTMEAKLLYGILLDRMSLSGKNGWCDANGKVFIIYTVEELMEDFGCSNKTAIKLLRELEQHDLIVRRRQGLGKPSLIYVKQIQQSEEVVSPRRLRKQQQRQSRTMYRVYSAASNSAEKTADDVKEYDNEQMQKDSDYQTESDTASWNDNAAYSQKQNVESLCPVTCKTYSSRSEENTLPEVKKVQGNKTERSYTEPNKKEEGEAARRSWKTMV